MQVKVAVFASGSGSNFQAIIDDINSGNIPNAKIDILIASKDNIYAINRAKQNNIEYKIFNKSNYSSLELMYEDIIALLKERGVDMIVLAGYLTILTPNIITAYRNQIVNIHPSLIPKYCGMGYYGIKVHEAVIEANEKESGATVHFVDEGADTGEIILQEKVSVMPDDTALTLQKRVLELEHKLLPKAVSLLCNKIYERYKK